MYCRPVKDLQLGVFRISDVREYPGVSYESSSTVVACMMANEGMCLWGINCTGTFVQMPDVFGPKVRAMVCSR